MNADAQSNDPTRHYLAILVEAKRLKKAGVSLDQLWAVVETIYKEMGTCVERADPIAVARSQMLAFWCDDLNAGLIAAQLAAGRKGLLLHAKIGHYDEGIWRTVFPVSTKPFAEHFLISDVERAKRFHYWLGVLVIAGSLATTTFLVINWRVAPWLTIPAFVAVASGFVWLVLGALPKRVKTR